MAELKSSVQRLDANEKVFFNRELEHVKTRTYDTKFKNLKAKMLIPVSNDAESGSDTITYRSFTAVGLAKIITDYANDFPRVDEHGVENSVKVKGIGASYGYTTVEIRRSAKTGRQLPQKRANNCRMAVEQKIDAIGLNGLPNYDIQGLIDYPGITEFTVPATGTGSTKTWSTKTPDQIIADLTGLKDAVEVPTKGVEMISQIIVPRTQYNLAANTRMTDGNSKTILTFFKDNNPGISIDILDELDGAGASATDRMMAYVRDPNNLTLEIPQPFEQTEQEKKGMEYTIPCYAECAGVIVYYPQSVTFGDGI